LLALERHHASELRKGLSEIKDHCTFLEEENEELNMLRFLNERQIADIKADLANASEPRMMDGDRDRGDRAGRGMMKRGGLAGGGHSMGRGSGAGGGSYQQGRGGGRGDGYGRRGRGGPRGGDGGRFSVGRKRMR